MLTSEGGTLAIIPARGGSKGLPGKNIRSLAGLPLIAHSILLAQQAPSIDEFVVSTDSPDIADVARRFGARVLDRPAALAQDDTPMWPVIRHALEQAERDGRRFEFVVLLDPTSPGRLPSDVAAALERLRRAPDADGIVGVSRPDFNPIWHCVVERDGWMTDLMSGASAYTRRQDVPTVYRINASIYVWRTAFVRRETDGWRDRGRHLIYEIPETNAIHIDDADEFARAEILIRAGVIRLPWIEGSTKRE